MVGGALHSDMTLGTVQLGMPYGIANLTGQPSRPEAVALVRQAIAHGVSHLDTARSYGESEEVLGESLGGAWRSRAEVITKLDPLESLPADASSSQVLAGIEHSILQSRRALATDQLPVLLLHRWHHHDAWRGEVWRRLLEIQASGQIGKLGASVYTPEEALAALRDPHVQHLQIPLNVLDRRWRKQGVDSAAMARPDVIVHARSAFLQGILLHSSAIWPITQDRAESLLQPLSHLEKKFGRQSMADLCLAYVRSQEWITSIVVGCDTISQLHENLGLFRTPKLTEEESAEVENRLQGAPVELLNPSKWKLIHDPVKAR
jgi:spore coat polysaccharide biosynthesis protein SpsF